MSGRRVERNAATGIIDSMTGQPTRFRHGAAERAAAVVWLMASTALAGARWWLLPLLLIPLIAVVAAFRRGTDIDNDGVQVHAVLRNRRLPWNEVAELRPAGRRVVVVSKKGQAMGLPAMSPVDLARLPSAQ